MRLRDWLKANERSQTALAGQLGVSAETLRRYLNEGRLPDPDVLRRIFAATKGQVGPLDFYWPDLAEAWDELRQRCDALTAEGDDYVDLCEALDWLRTQLFIASETERDTAQRVREAGVG